MALEVTAVAMLLQIRCALMWHDPLMSCMARTKASLFVKNLKLWNCSSLKCVCLPYLCAVYVFFFDAYSQHDMYEAILWQCVCVYVKYSKWSTTTKWRPSLWQVDVLQCKKWIEFHCTRRGAAFTGLHGRLRGGRRKRWDDHKSRMSTRITRR